MKISKSTQRRVIALFVLVCILFVPLSVVTVLQAVVDEDWRTTENITVIGKLDVSRPSYMLGEGEQNFYTPIELRAATADEPALMAEPLQYLIYATEGDYEIGTSLSKVRQTMLYISMVASLILTVLVILVIYQVIRGFRTGEFFTRASVVIVRVMAGVFFVGSLIWNNLVAMEEHVASDLCGELLPEGLGGAYVLNTESIVVPLVLLIVAELMSIAHRLNEEESATL